LLYRNITIKELISDKLGSFLFTSSRNTKDNFGCLLYCLAYYLFQLIAQSAEAKWQVQWTSADEACQDKDGS